MMEYVDSVPIVVCPDCEERTPSTSMDTCADCHREACCECMHECSCGCDQKVCHECSTVWEVNSITRREFRWRKPCLVDHADKLEAEAVDYRIESQRARAAAAKIQVREKRVCTCAPDYDVQGDPPCYVDVTMHVKDCPERKENQ